MRTISLKLPDHLLKVIERESRTRRITKSAIVRECLEKQLACRSSNADFSELPAGKSVYDLARRILRRAWARGGRGIPDLASSAKHMEAFGK